MAVDIGRVVIEVIEKAILDARRDGYAQALDDFAIWTDGVQRVGCMNRDIKEIMEEYDKRAATKEIIVG